MSAAFQPVSLGLVFLSFSEDCPRARPAGPRQRGATGASVDVKELAINWPGD